MSKLTSVAAESSDIKRESSAVDETLSGKVVNDQGIVVLPALESRTSSHDTSRVELGVVSNTEDLLADSGA